MNWTIIIIETLVMTAAFTAMILIPLVKNPVWWIHDYPEDIQEEYFKTHERVPSKFFTKTVLIKKGLALLVALAVMLGLMKLASAYNSFPHFSYFCPLNPIPQHETRNQPQRNPACLRL